MQIQKLDELEKIQIVLDQSGTKWIGTFSLEQIPQGMQLDKFVEFFTKCYSNESNCKHQIVSHTDKNLVIKLEAQMEFFTLIHELEFIKFSPDPFITRELVENVTKSLDSKLNKVITLVDLRKFEPVDIISDNIFGLDLVKHRIEFELSEKIKLDQQPVLVGYESSLKAIDLSAYPYEYIDWSQINNFYNLEEMIINGQTDYKFCAADSNMLDASIFLSNIIMIGTINPTLKRLSINNIYRVDGDLGYLDWAPNLEELTLIGCKSQIEILKYIKRNTKLKKINLINCIPKINDLINTKIDPSKPIYREPILESRKNYSYDIRGDIPVNGAIVSPWNNSSKKYSTSIEDLSRFNTKWQQLKAWCISNNIELNISGYIEDKETKTYDFPYIEYRKTSKNKNPSSNDNRHFEMTNMDVSGFMKFSMDTIGSNDTNTNSFASCI